MVIETKYGLCLYERLIITQEFHTENSVSIQFSVA